MHMQLIILMALAEGVSRIRTKPLTLHTKTAIHVAKKMTDGKVISLTCTYIRLLYNILFHSDKKTRFSILTGVFITVCQVLNQHTYSDKDFI